MPEFPLDLPPGIDANGTPYSRRGKWMDGSRIRWQNGSIRPIGGWNLFSTNDGELAPIITDPEVEVARAATAYKANDGNVFYVAGTNLGLKAWYRGTTAVHDITPADFTARPRETVMPTGYGMWYYGRDEYGTERQADELDRPDTFAWTLRNWGQNLLAAPKGAPSRLYEWGPTFSNRAVAVSNAPIDFDTFHVTDQRIVMCAGAQDSPRLVQWSTRENNNMWTPTAQNQAGSIVLPGTGRFKAIVTVQDKILLVSETDAYVARYLGPPYVYGFEQAGDNCGSIAPGGVVTTEDFAMWPGRNGFFMFDGSNVKPVPCTVLDRFRKQMNRTHVSKTVGFVNPGWSEIWWLYQEGDEDIDSYIFYNWQENYWSIGKLERTAAAGNGALGGLFMVGNDGVAYSHELQNVPPIEVSHDEIFIESAPFELSEGMPQYISSIIPDYISEEEGEDGIVAMSLIGQDRPNGPELVYGPYLLSYPSSMAQPVPTRARGHLVRVRIESREGLWRQGSVKLELKAGPGGRRK